MSAEQRKLITIMFSDMVGYSALSQKNEALALELLDEHRQILRAAFARQSGREIEAIGDGFFVEFPSALAGVRCAVDIQQALAERNARLPEDRRVLVRIGIHLGDAVYRGDKVHGDGVNIAARIEVLSEAGGICLSEDVARQVQNKMEFPVRKMGKGELKNIRLPMDVYRVVLPGERRRLPFSERLVFSFHRRRTRWVAGITIACAVLALASVTSVGVWRWIERSDYAAKPQKDRIAVLPFANLSADPENQYFVDGMTEELISRLSSISGLEVIARTSVMKYKDTNKGIAEIGQELRVNVLLEGSVRKAGNKLRITSQLIDVKTQGHLWSQDYDRELKDVLVIQSDVARNVAEALKVKLLAGEKRQIERKGTEDVEAYNLYLKGLYHNNKLAKSELEKGKTYFENAIAKDPRYAQPYAELANSYVNLAQFGHLSPKEAYPKAKAAVIEALKIDPTAAEPHAALARIRTYYDWDWPGAETEYKRAIELNPSFALAHGNYGILFLSAMGRHDEAIAEIRRGQELDPVTPWYGVDIGWAFNHARRFDHAIGQCQKTVEMEPNFFHAHWCLAFAYQQSRMHQAALAAYQKAAQLANRNPIVVADLAATYVGLDQKEQAQKVLNELKEKATQQYVSPLAFAWIYIALSEKDRAFEWLERAYEERISWLVFLNVMPKYDSLRSDPRFIGLLKKIGLKK